MTDTILSEPDLAALETLLVDARSMACPGPLLEAKKSIGRVAVGEVIEVLSSDPVTKNDVGAWAAKVGHQVLGVLPASGYERVFVRRGK